MSTTSRLEYWQTQAPLLAEQHNVPIASEPRLFVEGDTARLRRLATSFPLGDVVEFAATAHGHDPEELRATGIRLTDNRREFEAAVYKEPVVYGGAVHYPFMSIRVLTSTPVRTLNYKLRHEAHHIFDDVATRPPLHERPHAAAIVRAVAVCAFAGNIANVTLNHGVIIPGAHELNEILTLAIGVAGGGGAVVDKGTLWAISPAERAADIFAYRNRSFRPFVE